MRNVLVLCLLFVLALLPRLYGALSLGWGWDGPNSFTLINFDEAGSCRAALDGFPYSTFIGSQTIFLASAAGAPPAKDIRGDARAVKQYCHSPQHIRVARAYSAVLGALTVVALTILALQLCPDRPIIAWTAGALLAVSGFHISESQSGTVDAPSVFFIYAFLAVLAWAMRRRSLTGMVVALLLMVAAVWTKYWVFAIFAWCALIPVRAWLYLSSGFSGARIAGLVVALCIFLGAVSNSDFPRQALLVPLAGYYLLVPWRSVPLPMRLIWGGLPLALWGAMQLDLIFSYTQGGEAGRFGAGYAAIGANKWLRNLVNVPSVLSVGLGLPAFFCLVYGIVHLWRTGAVHRAWACLLPVFAFLLFMAFLAPVTYYRHYLPLLPVAALLAAIGLHAFAWGSRPVILALFIAWPALLAWDMVADYHRDPRIGLRDWYAEHPDKKVFVTFYVSPPPSQSRLFRPEYAFGDGAALRQADYLILSENWYDTAFPNELNGPIAEPPEHLVKTKPAYAHFYRLALQDKHPLLEKTQVIALKHFMPEMILHRRFYGNFQLFVGDLDIYRVR
jgi:hypothetical protein